jgi:hypothetical protein
VIGDQRGVSDFETLRDDLFKNLVGAVNNAGGEQSALLVIDSDGPAIQLEDVETALKGHFPKVLRTIWYKQYSLRCVDQMKRTLAEAIIKLRDRIMNEDEPRKAYDPAILAAAIAEGIPIERQPMLSVPGGQKS